MMKKRLKWMGTILAGVAAVFLTGMQAAAASTDTELVLDPNKLYMIWDAYDENGTELDQFDRVMYDSGGNPEGLLKYDNNYKTAYSRKYNWRFTQVDGQQGQYQMRNQTTFRSVKGEASTNTAQNGENHVVSDNTLTNLGGAYTLEVKKKDGDKYYVAIKSVSSGKYMTAQASDQTIRFKDGDGSDQNSDWWCIQEDNMLMAGQEGKQMLWMTLAREAHYRIPAIATANNGDVLAVTDKRYGSHWDIGTNWSGHGNGHQIDLLLKTSSDNGTSWGEEKNLTSAHSRAPQSAQVKAIGYGDAAIVADRETDKVLIASVSGTYGYLDYGSPNASYMLSQDGGKNFEDPVEVQTQIYEKVPGMSAFFFASGRIMQSRYVKVGEHYRIYSAILGRGNGINGHANFVFYSDDFGQNWDVLGGGPAIPSGADEAKVEELPNGDVLITSRRGGGRTVNVFHYDETDPSATAGSWDTAQVLSYGPGNSTNGEVYIVYAKNKATGDYCYLALQSLPTLNNGSRVGVSIFYKELGEADVDTAGYISGWDITNDKYLVQEHVSAYSTMTLQADGKIGFLWEERDSQYDILYDGIGINEITKDEYEIAFASGIGSKAKPYEVNSQEQVNAVVDTYIRERVNWKFTEECAAWLKTKLAEKKQEAETFYGAGGLETDNPAASALNDKITAAGSLVGNGSPSAEALFTCCQELVAAMDTYGIAEQLSEALEAKIQEAKTLYDSGVLEENQRAAVSLNESILITEMLYQQSSQSELYTMLAELTAAMEEYETVAQLSGELHQKVQEAEALKNGGKLSADRTEVGLLEDAIEAAQAVGASITAAELEEILADLTEKIRIYEDADARDYFVEARFSSNRIQIAPMVGVTEYKIYSSETQDGDFRELATLPFEADKVQYSYTDTSAGTGTRLWYKVEAVKEGTAGSVTSDPIRDEYETGVEAVQQHAKQGQLHYDFVAGGMAGGDAENPTYFDGSRVYEGSQEDLDKVKDLAEGSVIISYKPDNEEGRKGLLILKRSGVNIPTNVSGNLSDGIGFVFLQENGQFRWDSSKGGLRGVWGGTAPAGTWSTFGFSNPTFIAEGQKNAINSWNGEEKLGWSSEGWNGFLTRPTNLAVLTVGGDKTNNNGTAITYRGHIAYVTITDETFSQEELNAYTQAVTEMIEAAENPPSAAPAAPQNFRAEAGDGQVALSWTAVAGTVDRYEVSKDNGASWTRVTNATSYTFTGLENGTEYTFLVRAVNSAGNSETASVTATPQAAQGETVEAPVISPEGKTYNSAQTVTITCATPDAVIYYTTDGSEPTADSTRYTEAIEVAESKTIRAVAIKDGISSEVVSATYTISIPDPEKETVETPTFNPGAGTYDEAKRVTISTATEGAAIYYTTDGSEPDANDTRYSSPITVDKSMTVKAVAVKEGMNDSAVAEAKYTINIPSGPDPVVETVATPTFSVAAGTYTEAQSVEIATKTAGATIYYTTDGTAPTTGSTKYSKAITVDKTMTIKAIAVKGGMKDSAVATAAYTINIPVTPPADKPWIFTDVDQIPDHWKYESVKYVYNNDIMGAITGTTLFQPDRPLSRSMFATVLYRMADEPAVDFEERFTDVPAGKWYSNAIIWAYSNKIVSGYTDGSFGIDDNITREQIAKMLFEYADKVCKYDVSEKKDLSEFTDADAVSNWAVEYMQWATAVGMISGKPNDAAGSSFRMDPRGEATRAECAAMLTRFQDKYNPN